MAEIRWTREAESWLKDIHEYISQDSVATANRVLSEIYERVQILEQHPEAGYMYAAKPDGNIRILLYGHYRITYLIHNDQPVISVLGVFHGALEIDKYI